MKMTKKKAKQIKGLFAIINKMEFNKYKGDDREGKVYTQFDCDISFIVYPSCELISDKMTWKRNYSIWNSKTQSFPIVSKPYHGWHKPSAVYLYDDACKYEEFDSVVRFARSAIKAGGLDKLKYGTIKVVSEMVDYLDFEVREQE